MPALVKSRLGSFSGTSGALGTTLWPRWRKKSRKPSRIWSPVTSLFLAAPSRTGNPRPHAPRGLPQGFPAVARDDHEIVDRASFLYDALYAALAARIAEKAPGRGS